MATSHNAPIKMDCERHSGCFPAGVPTKKTAAQPAASLLLPVLPETSIDKSIPPPAMALIPTNHQDHISGYRIHPAVLDACLHSSAAAAPKPQPGMPQALRVPAGFAVMRMNPLQGPCVWPLAQPSEPASDGSVLCSFCIQGTSPGHGMRLHGLMAKPMPVASAHKPAAAAASARGSASIAPEEILYEIEWQCVEALQDASSSAPDGTQAAGGTLQLVGTSSCQRRSHAEVFAAKIASCSSTSGSQSTDVPEGIESTAVLAGADINAVFGFLGAVAPKRAGQVMTDMAAAENSQSRGIMNASGAVNRLLELVQKAGTAAGGKFSMTTVDALPAFPRLGDASRRQSVRRTAGISGASLWALLRVAAMEYPKTTFGGRDVSSLRPGAYPDLSLIGSKPPEVNHRSCNIMMLLLVI